VAISISLVNNLISLFFELIWEKIFT